MEKLKMKRDLIGSDFFEGRKGGSITDKQKVILEFIYNELNIPFTGNNSKQAYYFIGKYYNLARRHANTL